MNDDLNNAKTLQLIFTQLRTQIMQNAYMTKYVKNALIANNTFNDVLNVVMTNVVNDVVRDNEFYKNIIKTYDTKNEIYKYLT
jgi:hypothetical protein